MNWKELRLQINAHFDMEELRTLCFDLEIDFDSLRGEGKESIIAELVSFCRRRDRIRELENELNEQRPQVLWDKIFSETTPIPSGLSQTSSVERNYILSVGGGNGEYVLELSTELKIDDKHSVNSHSLFGGSAVNYSLRLMNMGLPVIPIPSIGNDDIGQEIREELFETLDSLPNAPESVLNFIDTKDFFVPNAKTQRSTIIVSKNTRTIFTEKDKVLGDFHTHVKSRIENLDPAILNRIKVVIIGHIHSDSKALNSSQEGIVTKYIIDTFADKSIIYGNFGNSQISSGLRFWEEYLKKLTVLQLNLGELKALFREKDEDLSLQEMIDELHKREITTVITLDKLGAVCTYGDGRKGIIFALPFKLERLVDTTGAGDAFGAGIVSYLFRKGGRSAKLNFSFGELFEAVDDARYWAAYACQYVGGSTNCPTEEQLY